MPFITDPGPACADSDAGGRLHKRGDPPDGRGHGASVAKKKDSMEICFIPDNDYAAFIERSAGEVPGAGNFVDKEGKILGRHRGSPLYGGGREKGLNLSMGHPVFVTGIRPETNEVVIGKGTMCFPISWSAAGSTGWRRTAFTVRSAGSWPRSVTAIRARPV